MTGRLTIAPAVVTAAITIAMVGIMPSPRPASRQQGPPAVSVFAWWMPGSGRAAIAVEVRAPGLAARTYTTGKTGLAAIRGKSPSREPSSPSRTATRPSRGPGSATGPAAPGGDAWHSVVDGADPPDRTRWKARSWTRRAADRRGPDRRQGLFHPANRRMEQDSVQGPVARLRRERPGGEVRHDLPEAARATLMAVHPPLCRPIAVAPSDRTLGPTYCASGGGDRRPGDRCGDR